MCRKFIFWVTFLFFGGKLPLFFYKAIDKNTLIVTAPGSALHAHFYKITLYGPCCLLAVRFNVYPPIIFVAYLVFVKQPTNRVFGYSNVHFPNVMDPSYGAKIINFAYHTTTLASHHLFLGKCTAARQ